MTPLITLSDYKTLNNITTSDYDGQISALLDTASDYVRKYCNKQFGVAQYTDGKKRGTIDIMGRFTFFFDQIPVSSVQEIEIGFIGAPGASSTLDVNQLVLFEEEGMANYERALPLEGQGLWKPEYLDDFYYIATYSGGEVAPGGVKQAVALIAHNMMEYLNRTNSAVPSGTIVTGEISSIKIGDYTESYRATAESLFNLLNSKEQGIIMNKSVQDLLAPYRMQNMGFY